MRKVTAPSYGRAALAAAAVLAIAVPSLVMAAGSGSSYPRPKFAEIVGPGTDSPSSVTAYTLAVTFTDSTQSTFIAPLVTWSANRGSWSGNNYTAPGSTGSALLTGKYTSSGATVTANRSILIQ